MSKKYTVYTVVDNAVTVLFVGGSHGNEQSGLALQKHSFQRRKDYKAQNCKRAECQPLRYRTKYSS